MTIYTVKRRFNDGKREVSCVLGNTAFSSPEEAKAAMDKDLADCRNLIGIPEKSYSSGPKSATLVAPHGETWHWTVDELELADGKRG